MTYFGQFPDDPYYRTAEEEESDIRYWAGRAGIGCSVCGHIACVCDIRRDHDEGCKFRLSATCAIPIECEHGRDCCPICDPCTCVKQQPEPSGKGE